MSAVLLRHPIASTSHPNSRQNCLCSSPCRSSGLLIRSWEGARSSSTSSLKSHAKLVVSDVRLRAGLVRARDSQRADDLRSIELIYRSWLSTVLFSTINYRWLFWPFWLFGTVGIDTVAWHQRYRFIWSCSNNMALEGLSSVSSVYLDETAWVERDRM